MVLFVANSQNVYYSSISAGKLKMDDLFGITYLWSNGYFTECWKVWTLGSGFMGLSPSMTI